MKKGSPIHFQSAMAPPDIFTSGWASKNVWKRKLGSLASNPDWPPSPIIVFSHFDGFPCVCQVPLSCVPPWSRFELNGLTERLWDCSVGEPLLRDSSFVGTLDRSCWQRARVVPVIPRGAQNCDAS